MLKPESHLSGLLIRPFFVGAEQRNQLLLIQNGYAQLFGLTQFGACAFARHEIAGVF